MRSNIDVQKVVRSLGESNLVNLDMSLREVVDSPAASLINSVAHLEPWELICYTWVTLIRRGRVEQDIFQAGALERLAKAQEQLGR